MALRPHDVRERHLHRVQGIADDMRHGLVGDDGLDAATADRESGCRRQGLGREVPHVFLPT